MSSNKLRNALSSKPIRQNLSEMLQIQKPDVTQLANAKLIKHNLIEPNPNQPRKNFPEESLEELVESIRAHGILQPLRVRPHGNDRYQIIAGERRWRASYAAGLTEVPCIVEDKTDEEAYLEALVENVIREDLNAQDRAEALVKLREQLKATTWEEVGEAVGLKRRRVFELLALLSLPEAIQADIRSRILTEKHGRALKLLDDDPTLQEHAYEEIKRRKLSGNQAMAYVNNLRNPVHDTSAPGRTLPALRSGKSYATQLERVQQSASDLSDEDRIAILDQLKELRTQIDATMRMLKAH